MRAPFDKKVALFFLALITFALLPSATAATPVVRIVDVPHTNYDGTFRDNELAFSLTPGGKLGRAVFESDMTTTWVIDAALLDEIIDMSDGYLYKGVEDPVGASVALIWLQQLRIATVGNPIVALPYGNPDASLARSLNSTELKFYSELGRIKLEAFFGRAVISQNGWGAGKSRLNSDFQRLYKNEANLLRSYTQVIDVAEINDLRARLGRVLNPLLSEKDRAYFAYQGRDAVAVIAKKLRVVAGRFQLTSDRVKVPLTLVNNFDTATTVSLSLIPMNSRVQVENVNNITIPPRSRIQISVPFDVIASGSTLVNAQFMTPQGNRVGEVSRLHLSLTVIDSRVAYFTTGAAIVLFLAAIAQSVRRIRRSRREK